MNTRNIKEYTRIPIEAYEYFRLKDLYLVAGMYLLAPYTEGQNYTRTDTTIRQLADLTGVKEDYIKDSFLPKVKRSGYILCETRQVGYREKRNVYTMPYPLTNYRIVRKELFGDNSLTPDEKGFMISLYCLCVNNEFRFDFNQRETFAKLSMTKNTYKKYENALMDKGVLWTHCNSPLALISLEHFEAKVLMYAHLGFTTWIDKVIDYEPTDEEIDTFNSYLECAA